MRGEYMYKKEGEYTLQFVLGLLAWAVLFFTQNSWFYSVCLFAVAMFFTALGRALFPLPTREQFSDTEWYDSYAEGQKKFRKYAFFGAFICLAFVIIPWVEFPFIQMETALILVPILLFGYLFLSFWMVSDYRNSPYPEAEI